MKQKLKSGDEVDVICSRRYHHFKSGTCKRIKRALNKRFRKEGKHENLTLQQ